MDICYPTFCELRFVFKKIPTSCCADDQPAGLMATADPGSGGPDPDGCF